MRKIVLASTSPRRAGLLGRIGLKDFEIVPPSVRECVIPGMPPEDLVAHWSIAKAKSVAAERSPEDIVIAADTVVWYDGDILGKPSSAGDAVRMLETLSGNWHSVYTAVTIMRGDEELTEEEVTSVLFRRLTERQIRDYVASGEPMDKAGAYGIQERGALLCERVDGDFYNVMGLPLYRMSLMLERFGVDLLTEL